MDFCSQCGQGNAEDASFCVQCGAPMPGGQQAQAGAAGGAPPTPPAGTPPPGEGSYPPPPPGQAPGMPQAQWTGAPPPPGMPPSPGMPPPGYPGYQRPLPNDGLAVAALVTGIAGWFICPIIGGVLAVIFGYMARNNIKASNGTLGGDAFATAGIILGFIQLGLVLLGIIAWVIIVIVASTTNSGLIMPAMLSALALV